MGNKIDITGVDLIELVKKVYELSSPQGLGILHFQEGSLSDTEAENIVELYKNDLNLALGMDYINGRACKFNVWRKDNKLYIDNSWYDHTDSQLQQLLDHFNIKIKTIRKHNIACNCIECQRKRRK